jgi:hypothetical protein
LEKTQLHTQKEREKKFRNFCLLLLLLFFGKRTNDSQENVPRDFVVDLSFDKKTVEQITISSSSSFSFYQTYPHTNTTIETAPC